MNIIKRSYHKFIINHFNNPRNVGSFNNNSRNVGTVSYTHLTLPTTPYV